jgi:hypothetical protein
VLPGLSVARALLLAAVAATCSLVLAGIGAGAALACDPNNHCYGITDAVISGSLVSGSIASINTHSLSSGNYCTGFASSEMWLTTGSGFIEDGIIAGVHANGTCGNGDQFFWGEFSTNLSGLYAQHFPGGSVGLNTSYSYKILFLQSLSWEVDRNGNVLGYANSSSCCSNEPEAGGESSIGTFGDSGEASGLQKQINNTWSYGWTGAVARNTGGAFTMSGTPSSDESWSH